MDKSKITFWKRVSIKFLSRICQYDIKNKNGNNHQLSNTVDFIMLLIYMGITIAIIVNNQFSNLSYGIILVSTTRMMLKHAKKVTPTKSENDNSDKKTSSNGRISFYNNICCWRSNIFVIAFLLLMTIQSHGLLSYLSYTTL